jgi:hypothetical protein
MESEEVSLALVVGAVPLGLWLLCGTVTGALKYVGRNFDAERTKGPSTKFESTVFEEFWNIVLSTLFKVLAVVVDTVFNVARTLLSYLSFVFLFIFTLAFSYLITKHNVELIYTLDVIYEAVRPNIVEMFLQVLNFTRVVFAIVIGVWNASVSFFLIPVRVFFDATFTCTGGDFLKDVLSTGGTVFRALGNVISSFFSQLALDNRLDVDVTELSASVRAFLLTFVDIVQCSCETIAQPVTQTLWHPLWNSDTDVR